MIHLKRFIENHNEIISEVVRHTAAVTRGIANNGIPFGDDLHGGASVEGIYQHVSILRFGKGEAEDRSTLCWGDLSSDVIIGEISTVIVGFRYFCLVRVPA